MYRIIRNIDTQSIQSSCILHECQYRLWWMVVCSDFRIQACSSYEALSTLMFLEKSFDNICITIYEIYEIICEGWRLNVCWIHEGICKDHQGVLYTQILVKWFRLVSFVMNLNCSLYHNEFFLNQSTTLIARVGR